MPIQRITSGILANGAIVAADIADGSVTTSKLADANVTSSKLASTLSISGNFLANNVTANTNLIVPAGSNTAPSIFPSGDTNTGIFFPAADTIAFAEGGAEAMRIDANGNVGIGTTSPTTRLHVNAASGYANLRVGSAALASRNNDNDVYLYCNSTTAETYLINGEASLIYQDNGNIQFYNAPSGTAGNPITFTERARITSGGDFCVNATSSALSTTFYVSGSIGAQLQFGPMFVSNENNTDNVGRSSFNFQRGGVLVGQIVTTNSTCAYNSVSDYRLKENIQPMTSALAKVAQLNPVTYTWKSNGTAGQGFIAHELQEVVPDCVTGTKDAVETYTDEEGVEQTRPVYQGIDTSFLVATLTAAIQELKAINDAQASRIETLEAKVSALESQ